MGLNLSKGNMYRFITHTWNTIKGKCPHNCSYCYMKRWGVLGDVHFDEKELKTDLGYGNAIFVGSSCDMFADNIHELWIIDTLNHCRKFDNRYFFQTKNPENIIPYELPESSAVCTTIETNRWYPAIMGSSPLPTDRACSMYRAPFKKKFVTIEPIMDFDIDDMVKAIKICNPIQVNIGADSGNNSLPEPSGDKILSLISELENFTRVYKKSNLGRLLA